MANPILDSLTTYIDQNRLPLIAKAVLKGKSASMFNLQTGVKTTAALNLVDTDVKFGDGSSCGWDEAGTSTLSQRLLETGQIKINMSFCDKDMLKYWTQYAVRVAAGQKTLPFEEDFINGVVSGVQEGIEKAIYQGDKDSTDGNLNKFDGLNKILNAATGVNKVTLGGTNLYADVMAVYNAIPEQVLDGASILVGADDFRAFAQTLVEKNFFHYDGNSVGDEIFIPGTNVKVVKVNGLNGTHKMIAGQIDKNFFYGCDLEGDAEKVEFWFSQDNREFRLAIEFNAGVQCARPDEVVYGSR